MAHTSKIIAPSKARLQRLISHGYFPDELPPPFTAVEYGEHAADFAAKWDKKQLGKFWTTPESYSMARYGHARRKLTIVNPINQLRIVHIISDNWHAIRKRLARSLTSEFRPKIVLKGPGRAITGVDFDGVSRRKAQILGSYGRYVKTDISRFYPSVYTHAIAWSILGKDYCKANQHTKKFKNSFANLLDKAVAAGQDRQTIGIPIGPDTSRVLSELVAVEMEEAARSHILDWDTRAVRYVDDMLIGLKDSETESSILSGLSEALYDFELEINPEKTLTLGMGYAHSPEWINFIRTYRINSKPSGQRGDLDSFFEDVINLADANPRENVLFFAVKRATSFPIDPSNLAHLVRWMLYAARRSPRCVAFITEHLAAMHATNGLPTAEIEDYVLQQIPLKAEAIHTDDLAWLLFWAREIGFSVPSYALENVTRFRSSVVALLTLDLRQRGHVSGSLDLTFWESFADKKGLKSEMWMVAYEATKKGWLSSKLSSAFITNQIFFSGLWHKDVNFYDVKIKARDKVTPIFQTKTFGPYFF